MPLVRKYDVRHRHTVLFYRLDNLIALGLDRSWIVGPLNDDEWFFLISLARNKGEAAISISLSFTGSPIST